MKADLSRHLRVGLAVIALGLAAASVPAQDISVVDFVQAMKSGALRLESAAGNGASSGASVECVLSNPGTATLYVDVVLHEPLFLVNSGRGQNMVATAVFFEDGSYSSWKDRVFIVLDPGARAEAVFLAYCADFDKDNPSAAEAFSPGELPSGLKAVSARIERYMRKNPDSDRISAIQAAVWMAQGLTLERIRGKFQVSADDGALARSFLE